MQLFHTSPAEITTINGNGRFGSFLFFSSSIYHMSAAGTLVYSIDVEEDDVIDAGSLFYHEEAGKLDGIVEEFCKRFDVTTDVAEEIISEREQLESSDADDLWDVQHFTARAAKLLGFRAVRVTDEQGSAYMVDMDGAEEAMMLMGKE